MDKADVLYEIECIKQLKARYFRFLDTKQWPLYRQTFTDDARVWLLDVGELAPEDPTWASIDQFVEWMKNRHDASRALSVHQGHMPEIEIIDSATARGIWAMFDWVEHPRLRAFQGFGHYYEEYLKTEQDEWRISSMRLTRLRVDAVATVRDDNASYGHVPLFWPDYRREEQ